VNSFVAGHEVSWELFMAALALFYVAVGLANDQQDASALQGIEVGLTVLFLAEFAIRLGAARDRGRYLRSHWIDAAALAPPIRGLRALRLLRLLRLLRSFAGLYRAAMHVDRVARHRAFAWLVVAWLAVMGICSAALYAIEHGINAAVNSPFDALWWGVVTLASVGYGDVVPVTPEGRLVAMVLMLLGIGLFSAITATITSYLVKIEGGASSTNSFVEELTRLADLRTQGGLTELEFARAKARLLGILP
jgi:voltage-gated potassium channel